MRRATQNLGLHEIPASAPSGESCKGFAAMTCLKAADNNALNFLTGVSLFKYNSTTDIHLSFGDKFGTVVFLYALHEDNTLLPAQLLCLDHNTFTRFAFPQEGSSDPVSPTANEWVRFNTDEFLEANKTTDQESVIKDTAVFRSVASRFIKQLGKMKNQSDHHDIFYPQLRQTTETSDDANEDNISDQLEDDILAVKEVSDRGDKKSKKKGSTKRKMSYKDIENAYEAHPTPRKRTAIVRYSPEDEPKFPKSAPKIIIDMNAIDKEVDREIENNKKSKKKCSKNEKTAKKTSKKKEDKTPNAKKLASSSGNEIVTKYAVDTPDAFKSSLAATMSSKKLESKNEDREYLRQQSILDLDLETKRSNQAFDMAERANRMA